ncbi:hypothetical protein JX265_005877 [Neoarthrinium moseri]|uniref:Uncharacterized protein n=1 Tax=Neoarthrinium moseri TaxID=1658444 RepID=A0A9Q0AR54_9PEZI|nr:uncharacterized protein JN550_002126 [Neoarthrinium moseri]KAI1871891.1 hypothetical protein JX265_005877 [Neoarthrinium moseri]KAI1875840.1 hypothetical protein JN550_002126 [Neoarthrinium moseri]
MDQSGNCDGLPSTATGPRLVGSGHDKERRRSSTFVVASAERSQISGLHDGNISNSTEEASLVHTATHPGGRDRQNLQEGARWGDINSKSKPSQWCRRSLDWAFVAPRPAETFIMLPPPKSPPNSDDTSNPQLPRDLLYVSYATPPRVQVIASTARLDWYQLAALVALSMRQPQDFGNTAETTTHGSSLTPPVI